MGLQDDLRNYVWQNMKREEMLDVFRKRDEVKEAVGKGLEGPRKLLKATSNDKEFQGTWAIKQYLPKSISDVQATGQSIEQHTKNVAS